MLKKTSIAKNSLHWPKDASLFFLPESYQKIYVFRQVKPFEGYPFYSFSLSGGHALLEGIVYNVSNESIQLVVQQAFFSETIVAEKLQLLTAGWTGEWCLWVQKGENLYIVNDKLGRLPVYWYNTGANFFVGRNLALLAENHLLVPDRMSVASLLWSSYLIGHRTIYKDVKRIPGGSFAHISLATGSAVLTEGAQINFDERSEQPIAQQAKHLAGLFRQACGRIAASWPGTINISQSGGQDSRSVAVGFSEAVSSQRLLASSFVMPGSEKDAELAKAIAAALQIPIKCYKVEGNAIHEQELLANKMGMNYLAMAFIHDFYKQMLHENSSFLYVTGDGGDKALPYLGEKNTNLTMERLVLQLSHRHATTPIEKVASLTGLHKDDILQMIYETVNRYPEQKMNNRSIHFTFYERAVQCFFEGEDRSRYFAWATTPFYDLDFFKAAMLVPDRYKKHYRIYRPFQNELSKPVADIPDASGHSINNWKFTARKRVQELFRSAPGGVKNMVRKLGGVPVRVNMGTPREHSELIGRLICFESMKNILDPKATAEYLSEASQEQYDYIRTLISLDNFLKRDL